MYIYICDAIKDICPNNAAIGYDANGKQLPDAFAVYYLVSSIPEAFFSNGSRRENERYSVAYYDRDKRNLELIGAQIKAAMVNAGFLYVSKSADIEYPQTNHWSTTYDFRYYEEVA
jgi:hypothetical protein